MNEDNQGRGEVAVAVGGAREMTVLLGVGNATGKREGRASDELRTAVEGMEV